MLLLLRGRANELQATKLPIDEPLQVEAAGGGMIGKSKGARTMACLCRVRVSGAAVVISTSVCIPHRRRTGDLRGRWNAAESRTATRARRWLDKIDVHSGGRWAIEATGIEVSGIAGRD